MRGRSLKEVQELLGHQTFAMTLRHAHLSPDRLRDAVASLDRPAEAPAQHTVSTKMVESPASSAELPVEPLAQLVEHLTFKRR